MRLKTTAGRVLGCDAKNCRDEYDVRYLAGATELNPDKDLRVCRRHNMQFNRELETLRLEREARRAPQAAPSAEAEEVAARLKGSGS